MNISQGVRPAQAGAAAAVAKKVEEAHKSEPLDSYGRSETGGRYDCWVYGKHKGEDYVDHGEGAKLRSSSLLSATTLLSGASMTSIIVR